MRTYPVEVVVDGKDVKYRLTEDFKFLGYEIPKGFISDGASVPRLFWSVFPPVRDYFGSALLHDYLLSIGTDWRKAEIVFEKGLKEEGIGDLRRSLMIGAVKLWGTISGQRK